MREVTANGEKYLNSRSEGCSLGDVKPEFKTHGPPGWRLYDGLTPYPIKHSVTNVQSPSHGCRTDSIFGCDLANGNRYTDLLPEQPHSISSKNLLKLKIEVQKLKVDILTIQEVRWIYNSMLKKTDYALFIAVIRTDMSLVLDSLLVTS